MERKRNKDLETLKACGGPFTAPSDVDLYMDLHYPSEEADQRLRLEVRYARDSSLTLPRSSEIFRLKKNYQFLPTDALARNIKVYLSKVRGITDATWDEFDQALRLL